jgi:PEGA domain-containing protein
MTELRIGRSVLVATAVTTALIAFIVWQLVPLTYPDPLATQRNAAPGSPASAPSNTGSATIAQPSGEPVPALEPLTPARPVQAPEPVIARRGDQPPVPRDATRTARPISAPLFIGDLAIDSDPPGASVLIDHRPAGQTPLHVSRLRAGSHVVAVERGGYERWTAAVSVVADTTTRVRARLQADRAR